MTKFALFDEDGFPVAFYASDIHGARTRPIYGEPPEPTEEEPRPIRPVIGEEPNPDCLIPAEAIEITDEQWLDMVQHPGQRRWQDGEVVEYVPEPPALDIVKSRLKAQLDADAEAVRLQFITAGAGQAMTYQQKAAEAAACLADPDPDAADYPLLSAEIGITAETLVGVATVVNGQHQAWRFIGGQIEAARLNGKKAIAEALTAEDAQAAFAAVEWPSP